MKLTKTSSVPQDAEVITLDTTNVSSHELLTVAFERKYVIIHGPLKKLESLRVALLAMMKRRDLLGTFSVSFSKLKGVVLITNNVFTEPEGRG